MDGLIRVVLLLIVGAAAFLMWREFSAKRRKKKNIKVLECSNSHEITNDEFIIISVVAKPSRSFESYDLLQSITAAGLQYGEKRIFHYFSRDKKEKNPLFSLASATKPGYFDIDRIRECSCIGLSLFMNIKNVEDPESAFKCMLQTAEYLADDLDGELRAGQKHPWTEEALKEYYKKIKCYSAMMEI